MNFKQVQDLKSPDDRDNHVLNVINSCETFEHLIVCRSWVSGLYLRGFIKPFLLAKISDMIEHKRGELDAEFTKKIGGGPCES
jgi:hypothetical protein